MYLQEQPKTDHSGKLRFSHSHMGTTTVVGTTVVWYALLQPHGDHHSGMLCFSHMEDSTYLV